MRRILLYLVSLPADLLALFFVAGIIRLLWGRRTVWRYGVVWVELRDSWLSRRLSSPGWEWDATTFGHVVMVNEGRLEWVDHPSEQVEPLRHVDPRNLLTPGERDLAITIQLADHELTHVEQYEAVFLLLAVLQGWLQAVGGPWPHLLAMQAVVGVGAFLAAMATAWLRGEHPYIGSHLEEGARTRVTCRRNPAMARRAKV